MVVDACCSSTWETEEVQSAQAGGQPGIHSEILFQNKKKERESFVTMGVEKQNK